MVKAGPGLAKRSALFPAGRGLGVGRRKKRKREKKKKREERRKKKAKVVLNPSAPNTPEGNTLDE